MKSFSFLVLVIAAALLFWLCCTCSRIECDLMVEQNRASRRHREVMEAIGGQPSHGDAETELWRMEAIRRFGSLDSTNQ